MIPNRALNNTQLPERATSEAVKAVPSKQKWGQIGPTVTSNSRIGPFEGFQDDKKKLLKRAPEHPPAGAGPAEAVKTGLSKTKLLPNGALGSIKIPRRVLTTGAVPTAAHYQDGALPKRNCCLNGSTTSNYRSEPLPKQSRRAPSKKEAAAKAGPRQDPTTGAGLY